MTLPKTISANVPDSVPEDLSSFLNASLRRVIGELFQNARRAGASKIDVVYRDGGDRTKTLTVVDDGAGIRQPQVLLTFGGSAWGPDVTGREHAAGIGFAAVGGYGAAVASRATGEDGFVVTLERDHFLGRKPAPVLATNNAPRPCGTSVCLLTNEPLEEIEDIIERLARHFPLPVSLTCRSRGKAPRTRAIDRIPFLRNTRSPRTDGGLTVAVSVYDRQNLFDVDGPTHLTPDLNVHGHVIDANLPAVHEPGGRCWKAACQVDGASGLRLTLPARDGLVRNPAARDLERTCYEAIYRLMASDAETDLQLRYPDWQRARELGFNLPEPAPALPLWTPPPLPRPKPGKGWQTLDPQNAWLMDPDKNLAAPAAYTLARALERNGLSGCVFATEEGYEACPWYTRLPKIRAVSASVTTGGCQQGLTQALYNRLLRENGGAMPEVEGCHVELRLETPGGRTDYKRLETDLVLLDDTVSAVAQDHGLDVDSLTHHLLHAYFSTDAYGDAYERELAEFQAAARHDAVSVLESRARADRDHAEQVLKKELPWLFATGRHVRITVKDGTLTLDDNA